MQQKDGVKNGICNSENVFFGRNKANTEKTKFEAEGFCKISKCVSQHWESSGGEVKGAGAALLNILRERSWLLEEMEIPEKKMPLRLKYYHDDQLCTIVDVDDRQRQIRIKNYVTDPLFCAFGRNEHPDYKDYEAFLESRCFPSSRDKMKIILKELNLPFYDPFMIIQKTKGRMAEDRFWIQIER